MKKKKIYIDITEFVKINALTGIQRVVRELIFRMMRLPELELVLISYEARRAYYTIIDNRNFLCFYEQGIGLHSAIFSNTHLKIDELESGSIFFEIDSAWAAVLKRSYLLPLLKRQGLILVSMIYDIMAITHFQYFFSGFTYEFMDFIAAHILYDDLILVNTQFSREALLDFAKNVGVSDMQVETIPLGGDFQCSDKNLEPVREKIKTIADKKPYLLLVGTIEPRKNHCLIYEAYKRELYQREINIIFAGRIGWIEQEFMDRLYNDPDFDKRIFHFSDASNADLHYLYLHAFAVAFPTHMEGYGLPIVEALVNGAVVIASDIPVLREVGADYCVYFKENNASDFALKTADLMQDSERYAELKAHIATYQPFTWDQVTAQVVSWLRRVK